MTLRSLYKPTPLSQPVSIRRGWLIVGAAVLSWLALVGVVQGLGMMLGLLEKAALFVGGGF